MIIVTLYEIIMFYALLLTHEAFTYLFFTTTKKYNHLSMRLRKREYVEKKK